MPFSQYRNIITYINKLYIGERIHGILEYEKNCTMFL